VRTVSNYNLLQDRRIAMFGGWSPDGGMGVGRLELRSVLAAGTRHAHR